MWHSQSANPTPQQVWYSFNGDGSYTVALFNRGSSQTTVTANWSALGFAGPANVTNLWTGQNLGPFTNNYSAVLNPHACELLNVVPTGYGSQIRYQIVNASTGQCLAEVGGSAGAAPALVQAPANGSSGAAWTLTPGPNFDSFGIVNQTGGAGISISQQADSALGTVVEAGNLAGSPNAEWVIEPTGTGSFRYQEPIRWTGSAGGQRRGFKWND